MRGEKGGSSAIRCRLSAFRGRGDNQTSDWHCARTLFPIYGWTHGTGGFQGSARNDRFARVSDFGFEGGSILQKCGMPHFCKMEMNIG